MDNTNCIPFVFIESGILSPSDWSGTKTLLMSGQKLGRTEDAKANLTEFRVDGLMAMSLYYAVNAEGRTP